MSESGDEAATSIRAVVDEIRSGVRELRMESHWRRFNDVHVRARARHRRWRAMLERQRAGPDAPRVIAALRRCAVLTVAIERWPGREVAAGLSALAVVALLVGLARTAAHLAGYSPTVPQWLVIVLATAGLLASLMLLVPAVVAVAFRHASSHASNTLLAAFAATAIWFVLREDSDRTVSRVLVTLSGVTGIPDIRVWPPGLVRTVILFLSMLLAMVSFGGTIWSVAIRGWWEFLVWRRVGGLPPVYAAAQRFLLALEPIHYETSLLHLPRVRRVAVSHLRWVRLSLRSRVTLAARVAGGTSRDRRWYREQCDIACEHLLAHERALLDSFTQHDFDALLEELRNDTATLCCGRWLPPIPGTGTARSKLYRTIRRRLVLPILLTAAALSLPLLATVDIDLPGLSGVQTALLATAVASLVAPDTGAASLVFGAVRDSLHDARTRDGGSA